MGETAATLTGANLNRRREQRAARVARRFDVPMLVAALLVIPVVVIEESHASPGWREFGTALNWLVWLAFATELVVMLIVTPQRVPWLREHPLEVAIVVLTPPFLPASLGALRLFRLLRLLRLTIVAKELRKLLTPDGVKFAAVVAAVAALSGGAIFADVEKGYSVWDGVWWAVTTMATVGYGDLSPKTVIGRLVAIALMFIGIGFFALITGAIAQTFLSHDVRELEATERQLVSTEIDARDVVLRELRELSARLQQLERTVEKL